MLSGVQKISQMYGRMEVRFKGAKTGVLFDGVTALTAMRLTSFRAGRNAGYALHLERR